MGVHYLILYKDLATLRKFYSNYTKKQIEENNEFALINTFYENTDFVRHVLYGYRHINIFKYERKEAYFFSHRFT